MLTTAKSLFFFTIAGLCEIGGGYLVWLWLREKRHIGYGISGAVMLILYGVIPTLQPYPHFGRVYAAYGGVFIILSLLWGWLIDRWTPDRFDLIGAAFCLIGMGIIIYTPRR